MTLNEQQSRVVNHPGGPLLVLACPGSGKTRCIIERIIYLIDHGVCRNRILAVTFTNKAADEMANRVRAKAGDHKFPLICTFHSLCVRILRQCCHLIGYKRNFSIYDDSEKLIRKITKSHDIEPKGKFDPKRLVKILEGKKNQLLEPEEFELHLDHRYIDIFREYEHTLKTSNSFDFGDLLYHTVKLFDKYPALQRAYATRYEHVLVDEMQDTNIAQLELAKRLASIHNNIIVVGDADQCFTPETLIYTPDGPKIISDFSVGDIISTIVKPGIVGKSVVTAVRKYDKNCHMVNLTLDDGRTINCTHNHLIPMEVSVNSEYFVYLMYKRGLGFRIGQCKSSSQSKWAGRLRQEHADAIWVIDLAESKSDILTKEIYWSIKYDILTTAFHAVGRKLIRSDDQIKRLYSSLDKEDASGHKLLQFLGYSFDDPHYYPIDDSSAKDSYIINVSLCAANGAHKYSICSNNKSLLEPIGIPKKSEFNNWIIENCTKNLSVINELIEKARTVVENLKVYMSIKADSKKPLRCQPAINILPGTIVYVVNGDNIERRQIKSVDKYSRSGYVHDLDVDATHNYIANGMVVHNSIYAWRHADINNILKLELHFPDVQAIYLNTNYRSTPEILSVAEKLINKNKNRKMIPLEANKGHGESVSMLEFSSPEEEAEEIANLIGSHKWNGYPLKEMAVLCRVNALTRTFEECFRRRDIPYVLIGSFGFYDRKEVKTGLSYMKFIANKEDAISFEDIINTPSRGIGPATIIKVMEYAISNDLPFLEVCKNPDMVKGVTRKAKSAMKDFAGIVDKYDHNKPAFSLSEIFEDTGFLPHLRNTDQAKSEHREDNALELLRAFDSYCKIHNNPNIAQYLQEIILLTSSDNDSTDDAVKLMTIHAAKGLEFDIVFVPGMIEDILPHKRSVQEGNVSEERRVCYVACTRARDYLYLTRAGVRMENGKMSGTMPSRFLEDMGLIEIDWNKGHVYQ